METLNFAQYTDRELTEMMREAGMVVPRKLGREEMILRLKLRILVDRRHFEALEFERTHGALGNVKLVLAVLDAQPGDRYRDKGGGDRYNDKGVQIGFGEGAFPASELYRLMLEPQSFDDLLLTLVPPGTYKVGQVFGGLINAPSARYIDRGFSLRVPKDVLQAYRKGGWEMVSIFNETIKSGNSVAKAIDNANGMFAGDPLPFEATWVEDVGLSGRDYPRIMMTFPAADAAAIARGGGDIWGTPPFGLRSDDPIPLLINGVTMTEYIELMDMFHVRTSDRLDDHHGNVVAFMTELGAVFAKVPHKPKERYLSMITNLREILDRVGMDELARRAQTLERL